MADISSVKLQDNQTYYFKDNSAIVSISRSGNTYTATRHDGTTFEFTQKDDNTTYTFEDGVNSFTVTPSNGTAQTVTVTPSIPNATQSSDGLMSATDKTKLDGVANGAEVNQNAFSNVAIGASTISADSKTDTLTLVGGANITLTPDATNDKITILLDDTVDTGEVIATDIQAGNLIVNGTSRFLNTINGTASNSEKLNGQSLTSTYSSTGTAPITGAAVASAIGTLDGTVSGSPSASKTLTAFSQTDGKVSATFGNISITKSQVSDFPTLGTAAAKNYTTSVSSGSADLVTSGAVWTAIDNLPEPMVFKGSLGTGGTITTLPVDGTAKVGDTYKVITAGTYASKAAKVGDTFICLTKTSSANTWELIPSGDEPSGTVTSVGISNGGGLSVSGSPITSSGTITISHADTSSQASVNNSGRTYIQDITLDTYGHVTGIASATETVVNTDRYVNSAAFAHDSTNDNVKMTLTRAGSDTATVTANIPKVSSSSSGVVPKGATVSSQSQTTKFLREDGTWAVPSYTIYTAGTGLTLSGTQFSVSSANASTIINLLATGSSAPTDNDYYIAQYAGGGTTTTSYHRRPHSALWSYIKGKTDATYLPLAGGTMTGQIVLASNGYKTNSTSGYSVDQYGNFTHLGTTTSDYWMLKSNNGTNNFSVYWETGNVTAAGNITAPKFIGALQGNADTATSATSAQKLKFSSYTLNNNYPISFCASQNPISQGSSTESAGVSSSLQFNPYLSGLTMGTRKSGSTIGQYSVSMGADNTASGYCSQALGNTVSATNNNCHAEGYNTLANMYCAHAEGWETTASGQSSHAEGEGTIANHRNQHVFGKFNIADPSTAVADAEGTYVEIVGIGSGSATSSRANARTLDWSGNEWLAGSLKIGTFSGSSLENITLDSRGLNIQTTSGNLHSLTVAHNDIYFSASSNPPTWDGTNTSLVTAVTQLKNTKADILAETIPNLTFSGGVATLAKKTGYILISIYPYARSDDGYGITSFTEQNDGSYKIRNNYGGLNASLKARAIWLKV